VSSTSDPPRGPLPSLLCSLFAVLLGLLAPAQIAAQGDATRDASARALFDEGVSFVERADWPQAEDRFRRALALRDSPVIAYNLASTLSEQGKLVEASELLRKLGRDPGLDSDLRKSSGDLQAQVTPRIARVRVRVENAAPGDVVELDGAALMDAQLNVEIPIDPGSHELQLQREGTTAASRPFELADGTSVEVVLTPPVALSPRAVAASQPKPAPAVVPARTTESDGGITSKWWFWTSLAVVVSAAAVSVAIVATSSDPAAPTFQGDFNPPSLALEVKP
jgi:hypothetical protein